MSFTFRSTNSGLLKMGTTSKLNLLNTSSSVNFESLNILNYFNLNYVVDAGILHTDSSGSVTSGLLATTDIANGAVTYAKLDTNLVLPFNTTLEILEEGDAYVSQSLVTVGLLTSNKSFALFQKKFFHITQEMVTDETGKPTYTIGANIKYILETVADIYLPQITVEGMYFSITNKSGETINLITNNTNEILYNALSAPYVGDPSLEVENHRTFDVISQMSQGESSWQVRIF